jgi:hypothetical protein
MESYEAIHKSVEQHVSSTWNNFGTLFPENVNETRPTNAAWARFSVRMADSHTADVTATWERNIGQIMFQVFSPANTGARTAQKWRDKIAAMFNEKRLETEDDGVLHCRRARMVYAGIEGGWTMHNVIVPFSHDAPALNAA